MQINIILEAKFVLLILFSFVLPISIYLYLLNKNAISRLSVLFFALLLIALSGCDVFLLRSLALASKETLSTLDDSLFTGELSIALYFLPILFAGVGVNLVTHVLIDHLNTAEKKFDRKHLKDSPKSHVSTGFLQLFGTEGAAHDRTWPEWLVFTIATIVMLVIFVLDLLSDNTIRLHVLYIFPLAVVALYCGKTRVNIMMFLLSFALQLITLYNQSISKVSFGADVAVAIAASALTIFLAMSVRENNLRAKHQAATDVLTNLPNRRSFQAALNSEIARQVRYGGTASLVLIDLDGFKALNDSMGHQTGDEALILAAAILKHKTRASDAVGRMGGDEFAVLMPNTSSLECTAICQQICQEIASGMSERGFMVTASIGCNTFKNGSTTASAIIAAADAAMYRVKTTGKNNVESC